MATSRQESDFVPERKRARIVVESPPTSLPSSSVACGNPVLSRWEFASTPIAAHQQSPYYMAAPIGATNDGRQSSDSSISLSGSSECASQISSNTPPVSNAAAAPIVSCNVKLAQQSSSGGVEMTNQLINGGASDLRSCIIRSSPDEQQTGPQSSTTSTVGVVLPWQFQDFGDGIPFDGSLSGLSDLAAPGYVSDMLEFVKRQSSHPNSVNMAGGDFFQYILMAPTSAAVKITEEPLTYLNQGQSYEIKCKKLCAEGMMPGRLYKSIIRVTFHDRRQKFHERELLDQWKKMHGGQKIIDADIPLSYNVFNVKTDPMGTMLELLWDPTKNTSMFIKVNCISTEFTARKHGGEKGVPFRLQVDTYLYGDDGEQKRLHASYAQIKVFKTKGADRKNKSDRDKAEKRSDKEKYQPPYEYTVLTETYPSDEFDQGQQQQQTDGSTDSGVPNRDPSPLPVTSQKSMTPLNDCVAVAPIIRHTASDTAKCNGAKIGHGTHDDGLNCQTMDIGSPVTEFKPVPEVLPSDARPLETLQWLRHHHFGNYLKTFTNFSGADLLRLSREDLIEICGTADGIRLFNALQYKKLQPKLTLYVCVHGAPAFHAVFLISLTLQELVRKVCDLIQMQPSQIFDVYCQGPDGINVHMNDEVVRNMPDRARYLIDAMKCGDEQSERYRILLKATFET